MCVCRTLEQAASVPVVYATAYYSMVVRGRLRPGESVLIHSGSGGVGQAAIAIALSMNCRVFTTVGECFHNKCAVKSKTSHCRKKLVLTSGIGQVPKRRGPTCRNDSHSSLLNRLLIQETPLLSNMC